MTPLSDAFLDRLASAAVREGLADAVYTTLSTPLGPLVVVQGAHGVLRIAFEGEPLDRDARRAWRPAWGRGSCSPTASSPRPATRSRPTSRATTTASTCPSTSRSWAGRSAARCSRRCTARSIAARSSPTARSRRQAGNPRAVRATGTACATNPIPIVVPCHRVLPASGRLGNYGGGPERKRVLLTLEGAPVRV